MAQIVSNKPGNTPLGARDFEEYAGGSSARGNHTMIGLHTVSLEQGHALNGLERQPTAQSSSVFLAMRGSGVQVPLAHAVTAPQGQCGASYFRGLLFNRSPTGLLGGPGRGRVVSMPNARHGDMG